MKSTTSTVHVLCDHPVGQVSNLPDGTKAEWTPEKAIHELPFKAAQDLVRLGVGFVALYAPAVLAARYKVAVKTVEKLIADGVAVVHEFTPRDVASPATATPVKLVALTPALARVLWVGIKAAAKKKLTEAARPDGAASSDQP